MHGNRFGLCSIRRRDRARPDRRRSLVILSSRRIVHASATILTVLTATGIAGGLPGVEAADAPAEEESCADAPSGRWPVGLDTDDRVFGSTYDSHLVRDRCGRPELVTPTGFDSCYVLGSTGVRGYPC